MTDPRAQRTLVKSPPELWAEISDAEALTRHLGQELGDIRITRTDPETTVAWEGDRVRGTVELEASGWGTKVTLTAQASGPDGVAPVVEEEAGPVAAPARAPAALPPGGRRPNLLALFRRRPRAEPAPAPPVALAAEPTTVEPAPALEAVLVGMLDDLGSAQKRPYAR